ncbi:Prostamide/prostaglandin F synthase [Araneus ventricosus]|uniref:Prostamide/prostaglandin F synthase n=1 Tax=Araneus ventricosus TaxID=182803 RepID=A0A4Y2A8R3_ARAVE|nr:Prostamide/prostaglandin F synthase [Araneus ventricosus]
MNEAEVIAENQVKSAVSGDFCRLAAKQLSEIKPKLDEHNVRLVGIGVEELGVQEFIDGKFFAGDLFIDVEKKCYKDLEYKRYGFLNLIPALFTKTSRDAISASREAHLGGDLKGDYYQVGGTLVVKKGGEKVLLNHKQESLADHVDSKEVLKCLNI